MEGCREGHRHPVMDIADERTGRAGEDYNVKLAVALLPGQSGQVQHRLRGTDRVLDFCCARPLPFTVPDDWGKHRPNCFGEKNMGLLANISACALYDTFRERLTTRRVKSISKLFCIEDLIRRGFI